MSDHEQLWTAVAQLLRAQVSEAVWFSTFQDVAALESNPTTLKVSAPNTHARDRILSRYLPLVRDALEEIGGGLAAVEQRDLPAARERVVHDRGSEERGAAEDEQLHGELNRRGYMGLQPM